ncbi:MAG: right-handed parallel beta-helix repeat-containing protein [Planctomycetota bacterium]
MRRLPSSWSASLLASLGFRRTKKNRSDQRHHRSRMEQLERREMLASDTYLVTTLADQIDGVEADGLSLREAIAKAATDGSTTDGDVIRFDPSLFADGPGTILLGDTDGDGAIGAGETPSQLSIGSAVLIIGPGEKLLTVSGGDATRVFNVPAAGVTTLSDFTVAAGYVAGATNQNDGAGIHSAGDLSLSHMTLRENHAYDNGAMGGGVFAYAGRLFVENSTFRGNSSRSGGGAAIWGYNSTGAEISGSTFYENESNYGGGGGLTIQGNASGDASIRVMNSTLSANDADYYGGGVLLANNDTAVIINTTIVDNTATNVAKAGVALTGAAAADLRNTVVADNYWGTQIRNGVGYTPSNFVQLVGEAYRDPMLSELGDYGGPTLTHAVLPGSPLIDAGDDAIASQFAGDQRRGSTTSSKRIVGGGADIGSFEAGSLPVESSDSVEVTSVTAGDPFLVFDSEDDGQTAPWVDTNAAGQSVVVWQGDGPEGAGVYVQLIGASDATSTPRLVDLGQPGIAKSYVQAAIDGDGNYAVVWHAASGVYLRRYRSDSAPVDQLPVQVSVESVVDNKAVSIASNAEGRLVVSWLNGMSDLMYRRYTTSGAELDANPRTGASSDEAVVRLNKSRRYTAVADDGRFYLMWSETWGSSASIVDAVRVQAFDAAGSKVGAPSTVGALTDSIQFPSGDSISFVRGQVLGHDIRVDGEGRPVVTWMHTVSVPTDLIAYGESTESRLLLRQQGEDGSWQTPIAVTDGHGIYGASSDHGSWIEERVSIDTPGIAIDSYGRVGVAWRSRLNSWADDPTNGSANSPDTSTSDIYLKWFSDGVEIADLPAERFGADVDHA